MWGWARFGIKRQAGPTAADVLRIAQDSLDGQREAVERRVQLAVAEAASHTKRVLDEHRQEVEQRVEFATSWAQSILDEQREAMERRAQLAVAETTSRTKSVLDEQREAVERRVQLAVAEAVARANGARHDEASTIETHLHAQRREFGRALDDIRFGVLETVEPRIQLAINEAGARTEERFGEVARDSRNLRQHVPGLLNATATVRALSYQLSSLRAAQEETKAYSERIAENHARLGEVASEIEALSRRVQEMGETDGGGHRKAQLSAYGDGSAGIAAKRIGRIVDEDRVEAARKAGNVRLNLRSGDIPLADYLNVDLRDLPGVDVVADADDLPFEPGTVSEIASQHALEHFGEEQLRRLLPYWRGLLKPEGVFRAVVPDGEAMLARQAAGDYSFEEFRAALFGTRTSEGRSHVNMFTPDSLGRQLTEAGFRDVSVPVRGRKTDTGFEFEITAIAP